MSHIETVRVMIVDLKAFKAACERLGVEFRENQKRFASFNAGTCVHAIHVPGCDYEIGLVTDGKGYGLAMDFWGPGVELQHRFCDALPAGQYTNYGSSHGDGQYTKGFEKLIDAYSTEVLKNKAYAQYPGCQVLDSVLPNGKIRLEVILPEETGMNAFQSY